MIEEAAATIFFNHPGPQTVASVRERVAAIVDEVKDMVEEGCAVDATTPSVLQHTRKNCRPAAFNSVLAPDSSILPPQLHGLATEEGRDTFLCPALDPNNQCGEKAERTTSVPPHRVLQQRLGHISRTGPANSAYFILDNFLRLETRRIVKEYGVQLPHNRPWSLRKYPGTSDYYSWIKRKLKVMEAWLGLGPQRSVIRRLRTEA